MMTKKTNSQSKGSDEHVKGGKTEGDQNKCEENKQEKAEKPSIKEKENNGDKSEKDNNKGEKDPTADAVEILQNMADEIATSTKPMDIDSN
jgi:hypothetical protein